MKKANGDHGLLRKDEAEGVMKTFSEGFNMKVIKVVIDTFTLYEANYAIIRVFIVGFLLVGLSAVYRMIDVRPFSCAYYASLLQNLPRYQ